MNNKNEIIQLLYEFIFKGKFFHKREYENGDFITNYVQNRNRLYFIIDGSVELYRSTSTGKFLLDKFKRNDIFGDDFININNNSELSIIASKHVELIYFTISDILNSSLSQEKKIKIIDIIYKLTTFELKSRNERIEILYCKSIRDKLLSYFRLCSMKKKRKSFKLDLSITELADYLVVNRSAMSREIKNLIDDGIIIKKDRYITLNS